MGRVGDDDVGLGHFLHHPALGELAGGFRLPFDIGVIRGAARGLREARRAGFEAVAIAFMHGYAYPEHERRVAELAEAISVAMGMNVEEVDGVRLAGLIHDIGKIAVPAEILSKPGRLSAVEFNLIKQHARAGYEIIEAVEFSQPVADMVLQHHERLDGSGYPEGLTEAQILPQAKILAVADVAEAMSSHRPYRPALGMDAALDELKQGAGAKYDAGVVAACVKLVDEGFDFTS